MGALGQGQRDRAGQDPVEHDVVESGLQAQGDPPVSDQLNLLGNCFVIRVLEGFFGADEQSISAL